MQISLKNSVTKNDKNNRKLFREGEKGVRAMLKRLQRILSDKGAPQASMQNLPIIFIRGELNMSEKEKLSNDELQQVNGGKFGDFTPINPKAPIFRYSEFAPTGQKDEQGRELCANYPDCNVCTDFCQNGWRTGRDWPMGR